MNRISSENKPLLIALLVIGCCLSPFCFWALRAVDYQLCYVKASGDVDAKIHANVLVGMTHDDVMKILPEIAPIKIYESSSTADGMQSEYIGFSICMFDKVDYQLIFHDGKLEEYGRYNYYNE